MGKASKVKQRSAAKIRQRTEQNTPPLLTMEETGFFARCAAQQQFYRDVPARPDYNRLLGRYEQAFMEGGGKQAMPEGAPDDYLMGTERFLAARIGMLLRNKERTDDGPVIAVDIGGGVGSTWLKLASIFEDQIEAGNLALLVTNTHDGPGAEPFLNQVGPGIYAPTARLYKDHGHKLQYAHYIPRGNGIPLCAPRGPYANLVAEVDIVHECFSVSAWGKMPELQIPQLGALLRADGILMTDKASLKKPLNMTTGPKEKYQRKYAASLGHAILARQLYEPRHIMHVETGPAAGASISYAIVAGGDAAPIGSELAWASAEGLFDLPSPLVAGRLC